MAPRPAKKQKRLIVLSSDEASGGDDDLSITEEISNQEDKHVSKPVSGHQNGSHSLPTKRKVTEVRVEGSQRLNTLDRPTKPSLGNLPEKPRAKPRAVQKVPTKGSLYSFFNSATQTQKDGTNLDVVRLDPQEEDIIQDDSPDEGRGELLRDRKGGDQITKSSQLSGRYPSSNESSISKEHHPDVSHRFDKRFRNEELLQPNSAIEKRDWRPWSERFAPSGLDELAVHEKKVLDVRRWLENAFKGQFHKRVLILKGPSGSGKTATMSVLAETMTFDIAEWRNPVGSEFVSESFLSMAAQFEDFLRRSGKFGSLDLHVSGKKDLEFCVNSTQELKEGRNKAVVIEDFPNTFTRTSTALLSFRSSVLQFLAASTPSLGTIASRIHECSEGINPLVMIISETLLTTTTAAADSFTAHRLLGADILNHPGVSVIEFSPIAPTFLAKALDLVIQKEARESGRRRTPGDALLKKLGEVGDVRSAIGSLEFLCVRGDDGSDWGGRVAAKVRKGVKKTSALTKMEQESIEMVTQREATLGIFHAVGKVVYNKRDESGTAKSHINARTPDHLSQHARPKVSQVFVDELVDETGTDTQTFVSALHENYVLSCDGPSFTDTLNGCIDALSDSDLLSPMQGDRIHSGGTQRSYGASYFHGAGTDNLRQEEICFQVAVRGLLFALPHPVKRGAVKFSSGSQRSNNRSDAFKMFYPTSLRLWKQTEEIERLVDRWMDASESGNPGLRPVAGSVESWNNKSSTLHTGDASSPTLHDDIHLPMQVRANAARTEMILEQLPYIVRIKRMDINRSLLRELDNITQFHGVEQLKDQVLDECDQDDAIPNATALWATDNPTESTDSNRQHVAKQAIGTDKQQKQVFESAVQAAKLVGNLVLNDDDIEDD